MPTAINPQTGERIELVNGQWVPVFKTQEGYKQPQSPTIADQLQRQLGLTARAGIQGLTSLPAMLAEIPRQALNLIPGVNFPPQSQAVSDLLTSIGLPSPETPMERIVGAGAQGIAGAGGFMGAGKALADVAPALSQTLQSLPGIQALSAGSGGIAGQSAAEMGAGPLTQLGASLAAGIAAPATVTGAAKLFTYQTPAKQKIAEMISQGSTDRPTAPYKLEQTQQVPGKIVAPQKLKESIIAGTSRIAKDKVAQETLRQGFDDGVIAAVKASSPADKRAMLKMTDIMEQGKRNARFAATNRPSDIAGETLMKRFSVIEAANRSAGKKLDAVAKTLTRKPANIDTAVNNFMDDLQNMGVSIADDGTLNFVGSDIEGLKGPQGILNQIFDRLGRIDDAHDAHRLKRFIDEHVSYGKMAEGLTGKSESILKSLRRNIDSELDSSFPQYDKVNTQYSETRGAIDSLQDIAGKKMDLTGPNATKAVGTLLRRILSNTQSRVNLLDSVNDIDQVAKIYGGKFNDDLITQLLYVDELDRVFGPVARTSFQGQISQAVERAALGGGAKEAVAGAAKSAVDKARGINNENAFKSIRILLR